MAVLISAHTRMGLELRPFGKTESVRYLRRYGVGHRCVSAELWVSVEEVLVQAPESKIIHTF